jgi:hypothetical protein
MICPTGKAEYFSQMDWTTQITLIRLNKSPFSRNGFSYLEPVITHPHDSWVAGKE